MGVDVRVLDELEHAFQEDAYGSVVSRVDRLLKGDVKRKPATGATASASQTGKDEAAGVAVQAALRNAMLAAKIAALIQLGKYEEASGVAENLAKEGVVVDDAHFKASVAFNRVYALYANHQLEKAQETLHHVRTELAKAPQLHLHTKHLEAQLLYRSEMYSQSRTLYADIVKASKAMLGKSSGASNVSTDARAAYMEDVVNYLAAAVMASSGAEVAAASDIEIMDAERLVGEFSHELLYNMACSMIGSNELTRALKALNDAEHVARQEVAPEKGGGERDAAFWAVGASIVAQKGFVELMLGRSDDAHMSNQSVLQSKTSNTTALAVASNNMAYLHVDDDTTNLLDLAKSMKVTTQGGLAQRLTPIQRITFGLNRALIFLRMKRLDAAKAELSKLEPQALAAHPKFLVAHFFARLDLALRENSSSEASARQLVSEFASAHASTSTTAAEAAVLARAFIEDHFGKPSVAAEVLLDDSRTPDASFCSRMGVKLTAARLLEKDGQIERVEKLLMDAAAVTSPSAAHDRIVYNQRLAETFSRSAQYSKALAYFKQAYEQAVTSGDSDMRMELLAELLTCASFVENVNQNAELEPYIRELSDSVLSSGGASSSSQILDGEMEAHAYANVSAAEIDFDLLESRPPPRKKGDRVVGGLVDSPADVAVEKKTRKRKRKQRLPKDYDPNGPPPDPERWLPKHMRAKYRKRTVHKQGVSKGTQGGDLETTAVFSAKQQKAAQAAQEKIDSGVVDSLPSRVADTRPKGQQKKKNKRKK
ncbi:Signal recognition particle subunit SRP72 [Porphyridium purpureum]|uniref:Signal recognition particle subunit SRP72 n=1 Tax=Porphyridium purpureum TaxID=35688 RepID=A0A5J4YM66_PORPP|nr:Signal recognition particle subunit SRP72 [Porphyridium purpureum]|eukprot:POR5577..scf244_11